MCKSNVFLWAIAVIISFTANSGADWQLGDGHKMHFPQLPDENGWDVYAMTDVPQGQPLVLADDWQCAESGPVSDIHFWGSWQFGITGTIIGFHLSIYSNVPADPPQIPYSQPGTLLWQWDCYSWTEIPIMPPIVINEIYYDDPGSDLYNFAELKGPPGASLNGFSLVGVNGSNGSDYVEIDLSGYTIPMDGYFVVGQAPEVDNVDLVDAGANWQNGPDNIQLRVGAQVVDAVGYGDFTEAIFVGEGNPAPEAEAGSSIGRMPDGTDTDDNSADFAVIILPTPGAENGQYLVINEIYYDDPGSDLYNFAELKGPPGASLNGFSLVGVNGSDGSDYVEIDLSGYTIPMDGYFVVGQAPEVDNVDLVDAGANWQNGPDNIQLRVGAQVVDAVGYGDFTEAIFVGEGNPAPEAEAGSSIGRMPDGTDTDDNSVDFAIMTTPTPGELNMTRSAQEYGKSIQGWYFPYSGTFILDDHSIYFQYNITDIPDPFMQTEGEIYWIAISATIAEENPQPLWGWKSSADHWNDDAVWAYIGDWNWVEMYEPPDFLQSLDLAFVITSSIPCVGICGDANNDLTVNVSDAVKIINYVFVGGGEPVPVLACGDANNDGTVNVSDAVKIINYVFVGGGPPGDCSPGSPNWYNGDCCPFTP